MTMPVSRPLFLALAVAVPAALAGCSQPTGGLTHAKGNFQTMAMGPTEVAAVQEALRIADAACGAKGQEAFVLTRDNGYRGVDQNKRALTGMIVGVSPDSRTTGLAYSHTTQTSDDSWRAVVELRCGQG